MKTKDLKTGEVVSVINDSTKKYEKAVILSKLPTGDREMDKYRLSLKIKDKREILDISLTAIHAGSLIGQFAK